MPPLPTLESAAPAGQKPLRQRSTFYIAVTHWLTAAFAVPLIGGIIFSVAYAALVPAALVPAVGQQILFSLVGLGFTWLGVRYSAGYVNAHYRVADARLIAKRSTIVATVIGAASRSFGLSRVNSAGGLVLAETIAIDLVFFLALLAVFYLASVRYLRANA